MLSFLFTFLLSFWTGNIVYRLRLHLRARCLILLFLGMRLFVFNVDVKLSEVVTSDLFNHHLSETISLLIIREACSSGGAD